MPEKATVNYELVRTYAILCPRILPEDSTKEWTSEDQKKKKNQGEAGRRR